MSAQAVARAGHRAFRRGRVTVIPGWLNFGMVFLVRLLPRWLPRRIVRHYNQTR
jgi:short-subunit dehydrogenase